MYFSSIINKQKELTGLLFSYQRSARFYDREGPGTAGNSYETRPFCASVRESEEGLSTNILKNGGGLLECSANCR